MADLRDTLYDSFRRVFEARREVLSSVLSIKTRDDRRTALARLVGDAVSGTVLARIGGTIYVFNGMYYEPDLSGAWMEILRRLLVDEGVQYGDVMAVVIDKWLGGYIRTAEHPDPSLVCFLNGVLDLDTLRLHSFGAEYLVDGQLPFRYEPSARCPEWEKFLEWALPEPSERNRLQEMFGSCYLNRRKYSIEKFAILIGSGANGKSVVCETVKAVMGGSRYVKPLDAEQLRNEKYQPELIGARCNIASDCRADAAFDSALKSLVSGQEVMGRRIYGQPESIFACPIVFTMNTLPPFRDKSDGFFRRILLFRFLRTVPPEEQDRGLSARFIRDESSGIFNWLMAGASQLRTQGYQFSACPEMDAEVEALKARVRQEGHPVASWMRREGWSVVPLFDGQRAVQVGAGDIWEGLGGDVSKTLITRELHDLGVRSRKSGEMKYYLYKIDEYEDK